MTPKTKAPRLTRPFHISRWTGLTSRQKWWLWRVALLQPNYKYQHSILALLQSSSYPSSTSSSPFPPSPLMGSTGSRAAEDSWKTAQGRGRFATSSKRPTEGVREDHKPDIFHRSLDSNNELLQRTLQAVTNPKPKFH